MNIKSKILEHTMSKPGVFYVESSDEEETKDPLYFIYFDDKSVDMKDSIKVNEEEDKVTIYTTTEHKFNDNLGFMVNLCSTHDKDCANMICEALNNLKEIYKESQLK